MLVPALTLCSHEGQLSGPGGHRNAMGGWPEFPAESCFIFGLNAFPD